jgi:repressor LexA
MNIPKIKYYMNVKGMTQEQLGQAVGVSETTINSYITGKISPRVNVAQKISDVLEIPTDEIGDIFFSQ